jgi:hypothetical protein
MSVQQTDLTGVISKNMLPRPDFDAYGREVLLKGAQYS